MLSCIISIGTGSQPHLRGAVKESAVAGGNATFYDATTASALKRAFWNTSMTRDRGSSMAEDFATAYEYPYQAVIPDMLANPEMYHVLIDNYCTTPIQ